MEDPAQGDAEDRNEDLLDAIIARYLEDAAGGRPPDRRALIASHPGLAAQLEEFFRDHDAFRGAVRATGRGPPELPALAPGERLGDYEIIEEIARGGMGIVYRSRQVSLGREAALKIINPRRLDSDDGLPRFLKEAETAAALEHPSIAAVHAIGEAGGRHYIAMEFLEGGNLRDRAPEYAGKPAAAAALLERIARAVAFAHERGILHRDLKPANILFDRAGNSYVSDFGLARRIEGDPGLTRTGEVLGTPSYIAPELLAGTKSNATRASDIYGLGAILYEVLAGRPPFPGDSHIEVLDRIRRDEPLRPRAVNPLVPRDLETICLQCLEKNPARRYPSAEALAEDLARFLQGRPIAARRASAARRLWRWCRIHPALSSAAASALVALVLIAVLSASAATRLRRERDAAREALRDACIESARAARHAGRVGQRFQGLERIATAAGIRGDLRLRSEAVGTLALADLRLERTLDGGLHLLDHYPVPDPKLQKYAFRAQAERIVVRRLDGAGDAAEIEDTGGHFRFSPAGKFLAVFSIEENFRRLRIWTVERPLRTVLFDPDLAGIGGFQFEVDDASVLAGRRDGSLVRLSLAGGETQRLFGREEGLVRPSHLSLHTNGELLAVLDVDRSRIQVWRLGEKKLLREIALADIRSIQWHPFHPWLAIGQIGPISVWDAQSGARIASMSGHYADVISLAFDPDSGLLASTSFDRTVRLWSIETQKELVTGTGFGFVIFGGNGRLATLSETLDLCIWQCATGAERRALLHRGGLLNIGAVFFSPDDRYLASAGQNGVSLWELPAARRIADIDAGPVAFAFFDARGDALVTWGARGLRSWRLADGRPADPDSWAELGEILGLSAGQAGAGTTSRDGSRLALITGARPGRLVIFDRDGDAPPRRLDAPDGLAFVALDPPGRLLAAGTFRGAIVRVWDADSGAIVRDLPVGGSAGVAFAPDGRSLAVASSRELSLWDCASWEKTRSTPSRCVSALYGFAAFSPAGDLLAAADMFSPPRLIEARTGNTLTELLMREQRMTRALAFSASGRHIAIGTDDSRVHLWDLDAIRRGLRELALDW